MKHPRLVVKTYAERVPRLARFCRGLFDLLDKNSPAVSTPWGFTLAGDAAMASGDFEPEETRLVRCLLKDVDVFVNIGANVGYYCCHALSMGKSVIAFEPIARNVHYLLRNLRENGWAHQAEVYPLALGAKVDVLNMWGGGQVRHFLKAGQAMLIIMLHRCQCYR